MRGFFISISIASAARAKPRPWDSTISWIAATSVIFEWPERILEILPAERLWIDITMRQDDTRDLEFVARGERYRALIDALRGELDIMR